WSIDPEVTFRRSVALVVTTVFALLLRARYSTLDIVKLLAICCCFGALLSLAFVLIVPDLGIMPDAREPAWRGIFLHKNVLGQFLLWGATSAVVLAGSEPRHRLAYYLAYCIFLALIVPTHSITSLIIGCLLAPAILVALSTRSGSSQSFLMAACFALAIAAAAVTFILVDPVSFLGVLDRESTLTGRADLWQAAFDRLQSRLWLG